MFFVSVGFAPRTGMISALLRTAGGRHYRRDGPSGSSAPGSTEEAEARHMVAVGSHHA